MCVFLDFFFTDERKYLLQDKNQKKILYELNLIKYSEKSFKSLISNLIEFNFNVNLILILIFNYIYM